MIAWLPAVAQQIIRGKQGNIGRLFRYFALNHGSDKAIGMTRGAGIFAVEFKWLPPWLGGSSPTEALLRHALPTSLLWLLVPFVLVAVGAFAARRSGSRAASHAVWLTGLFCATGLVAIGRVRGALDSYLFYWRISLAVMLVASTTAAVGTWLRVAERWRAPVAALLFALVAFPSTALAIDVARADRHEPFAPIAEQLIDTIAHRGLPRHPFIVGHVGSPLLGLEAAIVDELDRRGAPVRVDKGRDFQFGERRAVDLDHVDEVWYALENGAYTSLMTSAPHASVLAATTPLTARAEREARRIQRALVKQLEAAGRLDLIDKLDSSLVGLALAGVPGVDHGQVDRLAQLNGVVERRGHCRCSVVSFPASALPTARYLDQ